MTSSELYLFGDDLAEVAELVARAITVKPTEREILGSIASGHTVVRANCDFIHISAPNRGTL